MVAQVFNADEAKRNERFEVPYLGQLPVIDNGRMVRFQQFYTIMVGSARHTLGDFVLVQLGWPEEGQGAYVPLSPGQARDIANGLLEMATMVERMDDRP